MSAFAGCGLSGARAYVQEQEAPKASQPLIRLVSSPEVGFKAFALARLAPVAQVILVQ
jgi:hypothetical protein